MKTRILIVEDESIIALDLSGILRNLGYGISGIVPSGARAIDAATADPPDLILMDIILLGDMDGIEAARRIRSVRDIPVIYLTANADPATVQRARDTEPYAYLNKPVDARDLYSNIDSALYKHATERRLRESEASLRESEEKYRSLVENISDVIFTLDNEGRFTYVSPVIERISGYRPEDFIGSPFHEFIHPDDLPALLSNRRKVLEGYSAPAEYRVVNKDGTVHHIRTSSRLTIRDGAKSGLTGILSDITERRRMEESLRESEARFRRIVETATEGIWEMDADRRTVYVNGLMARMLGTSPERMIGLRVTDFMFPEDIPAHEERMERRRRGEDGRYEQRFRRADGSEIWCIVSATALLDSSGTFKGSFAMLTDISEHRALEAALRESEGRLRGLFDQAADAIFVHDLDGRFIDVNRVACESLGYTREELLGMTVGDVDPDTDSQPFPSTRWEDLPATFSARHRRKDGSVFPVEIRLGYMQWEGERMVLAIARNTSGRSGL
ncbi:MAG: PAS domain S-box protein [Spirochaetota bacterium]